MAGAQGHCKPVVSVLAIAGECRHENVIMPAGEETARREYEAAKRAGSGQVGCLISGWTHCVIPAIR